jgi:MFS family permease
MRAARLSVVRRLLVLVSSILFVDAMLFVALTPLIPGYADEFGLSDTGAGLLVASFGLGAVLGGIPAGYLALRAGAKAAVVAGLAGISIASLALALAGDPWLLGISRVAQGAASSAVWAGALAWLTVVAPRERRGQVLGTAFGVAIAGAIVGPMLGGFADVVGTRPSFTGVAVAAALLAALALRAPAAPREHMRPGAVRAALRDAGYIAGVWLNFLIELLFATLALLVPLALDEHGFSALAIGAVFLASGAVEVVLNPFVGRASDRYGRLRPLRFALMAATIVCVGLALADGAVAITVLVIAAAFGFGALYSPAMALVADRADTVGLPQGLGFGLMNTFWALGLVVGPLLAGAISDRRGDQIPYLIGAALTLATLVATTQPLRRRLVTA